MSWIELPDIVLHTAMTGAGPRSVVLLHELGGSLESFDGVVARLPRHLRVLRYDQRGAGQSEKPRHRFAMDDHVRDLVALLAASALPPPYLLAGVAAGCAIAVGFAIAAPAEVAALLLCAPALAVAPERRSYLVDRSELASREGMRAIAAASLDRSYPAAFRNSRFEVYRARFLANDPVSYGYANLALADASIAGRLGEIAAPCHVLAGRHDGLRPPDEVQAVAAAIPDARFAVVESGHLMAVQASESVADAIAALSAQVDGIF